MIPEYNRIDENDSLTTVKAKIAAIMKAYEAGEVSDEEIEAEKAKVVQMNKKKSLGYTFTWLK